MTDEAAETIEHGELGGGYRRLVVKAPKMAADLAPGQFVHVRVPALEPTALRRPLPSPSTSTSLPSTSNRADVAKSRSSSERAKW